MVGFTFGQLLIGVQPLAAQGDCQLVFNATIKVFDTPAHIYITMNKGGTTQAAEWIYVAGASYTKFGGKWRLQAKMSDETDWTYYDRPLLEDLLKLKDIIDRKYQRRRASADDVASIDKLISNWGRI